MRFNFLKPRPLRRIWRCVPSPQSIRKRNSLAITICPGIPRWTDGADADVPRKCTSNILALPCPDFNLAQEQPIAARLVVVVDGQALACFVAVRTDGNVKLDFRE